MKVKGDTTIGLKVLSVKTGEEIDTIKELIYDPKQNKVLGFLIDKGGWFSDAKVILIEDIESIGRDAVMIASSDVIKKVDDIQGTVARIADEGHYLTNTKVITREGNELGEITDIFFDSTTGNVEEFEVSQGLIGDAKNGKKTIRLEDIVTVGKEASIVDSFTEVAFEEQEPGGLTKAINTFKEKGSEIVDDFKEQSGDAFQMVKEKTQTGIEQAKDYNNKPETQEKKEQIKEKFSSVKDGMKENFINTKDTIQEKSANAKETMQQKMAEAKDTAIEKKSEVTMNSEAETIDDAVGKYVTTNIIEGDDVILLKRGDMITYESMRKAKEKGLTKKILGNLSEKPVL